MKRLLFVAILLTPLAALAAISSANDRRTVSGEYVAPNATGVSTQFERMAAAGDFLVGGEPAGAASATGSLALMGVGK